MMRSESTRALGQPRDTKETFGVGAFIRKKSNLPSKLTIRRCPPKAALTRIPAGKPVDRGQGLLSPGSIQRLAVRPGTRGTCDLRRGPAFTTADRSLQHPVLTQVP